MYELWETLSMWAMKAETKGQMQNREQIVWSLIAGAVITVTTANLHLD